MFDPSRLFFRTRNTLLAFALREAGIPWKCKETPCINIYDAERLPDMGVSSIQEAVDKGIPGEVDYFFERSETLSACLKAFDDEQRRMAQILSGNALAATYDIEPEEMARLVCRFGKTYPKFKGLWREMVPKLRTKNPGKERSSTTRDGKTKRVHPGYRIVGRDAGEKTLKHLKLR